ncbi:hypothetical protein [Sulfurimonas paralvinellae]|uniref:Indole-3-glycerol-phosphate synthase n=1 Tax=Sulfurimonas paralvinellae TaxID=317658 RepID=A0A7M1B8G2_9BACT|nr:hypothetical protein [Sulfurimonas paralvinellae]QOP45032.1 hypothetical protein FM071_01455 [Sulfurimonas paralvinellae]
MLLFGHRFIKNTLFYHVFDIENIEKTPSSSRIYLTFSEKNLDIITHLQLNQIPFALGVTNITELIYASALGASFIMVEKELAKTAQSIAENYLFDAKILVHINKEESIEEMALLGIDGVIFPQAIVKVSS